MKTTVSLVGRVGSAEILAVIQEQIKKVYMVQDKKSGQCEDYMDIDMKRADVSYNWIIGARRVRFKAPIAKKEACFGLINLIKKQ